VIGVVSVVSVVFVSLITMFNVVLTVCLVGVSYLLVCLFALIYFG